MQCFGDEPRASRTPTPFAFLDSPDRPVGETGTIRQKNLRRPTITLFKAGIIRKELHPVAMGRYVLPVAMMRLITMIPVGADPP